MPKLESQVKFKGFWQKSLASTVSKPPAALRSSASVNRNQERCKKPWKFNVSGVFPYMRKLFLIYFGNGI